MPKLIIPDATNDQERSMRSFAMKFAEVLSERGADLTTDVSILAVHPEVHQ